jgi:glycosyltransferase involved in cell wall biosynthesis
MSATGQTVPRGRRRGGHVLVVVENVAVGIDTRLRKQIDTLLDAGHRLSVVTRRHAANDRYRSDPRIRLFEHRPPPEAAGAVGYALEYGLAFLAAAAGCARACTTRRVHVAQFCQPPDIYWPIALALRAAGVRVVVDQRDLMPELFAARYGRSRPLVQAALRWLERRSCRAADRVLCVNGYLAARVMAAGADPRHVTVVGNGPVLARTARARPDPALRDGRALLCCWIGKMGRQDRLDLLLRAIRFAVVDLGRSDCRFLLLGDGECLEETRSLARDLGLDPWVGFTGWVGEDEVFAALATADLGLDASLQAEVSPVKALEYMALGLPIASFDLEETRAIADGAAAFAEPGDVRALGSLIDELLRRPDRRREMGRVGRDRMLDALAWERQAPAYLQAIDELMPGGIEAARRAELQRRRDPFAAT